MKKWWLMALVILVVGVGCTKQVISENQENSSGFDLAHVKKLLQDELRNNFRYFEDFTNWDESSKGYGLVLDRAKVKGDNGEIASIATTGLGITALVVGVDAGFISFEEAKAKSEKILLSALKMPRIEGFYFHFVNINTGEREWNSEISNIDTAFLIASALIAGQYFGGNVQVLAQELYESVNWAWFINPERNMYYMAYSPERGFEGAWDFYAEQLILYVLGVASPTNPIDPSVYSTFIRDNRAYGENEAFIHSWFGSHFTHQFSHAYIDFRGKKDSDGVDWFENSILATKTTIAYSRDNQEIYKGWNIGFGQSAGDIEGGYSGLMGFPPTGFDDLSHQNDGTLPTGSVIASIVFDEENTLKALEYYASIQKLNSPYGLRSSFNATTGWVSEYSLGLDLGFNLLMIANYNNELIWNLANKSPIFTSGLEKLNIRK